MDFSCRLEDELLMKVCARSLIEAINKLFSNSPNLEAIIKKEEAIVKVNEIEYKIIKEVTCN
jgi:hypothetical protein